MSTPNSHDATHIAPVEIELCSSPVFIVGSPRSGTTALAHALNEHSELWVSKESYFIHQLFGNGRIGDVWSHNQQRATPSWLRHEEVSREEFLASLGLGVNALYTSRSGGRRWIDQTPRYTPMIEDLADLFPGSVFVHIVRDGRAVVRSMSAFENALDAKTREAVVDELPDWVSDFGSACATWAEWVSTAASFAEESPERVLAIRNEDLAAEPEMGFSRLLRFLGVSQEAGPALAFARGRVNSSFGRDIAGQDAETESWPAELRDEFVRIAGEVLISQGYTTAEALERWRVADARA